MLKALRSVVFALALLTITFDPVAAQDAGDGSGDLGAEVLGGTLGLGAGAVAGFGTLFALGVASDWCGGADAAAPCLVPVFVGIPIGVVTALFTIPGGVELAGRATDGRGSYWASFLGSLAVAAPASIALVFTRPEDEVLFPLLGGLTVAWVAGAIVGYRVSAPHVPTVGMAIAPDGRGGSVSLGGRF